MLKQAVNIVRHRNEELKNLSAFSVTADVSTARDGAVFWSGDKLDRNGKIIASAMETAHAFATKQNGAALEQTVGGLQLESYSGHTQSFNYLKSRFKYTDAFDKHVPQSTRKELLTEGAIRANTGIGHDMGNDLPDSTGPSLISSNLHTVAREPNSVAGALWDNMSARFASQAKGIVNVIHAASKVDPYFRSKAYANSTWQTKERRILQGGGKTTISEHFGEDLGEYLRGSDVDVPDYTDTGGFKGNLDRS